MSNSSIKTKIIRITFAIVWGFLSTIVAYLTTTSPEQLPLESYKLSMLESCKEALEDVFPFCNKQSQNWNQSVTMIDVHYEKIMRPEYLHSISPTDGETITSLLGNVAVTDHSKLLKLLKFLQGKNYKYIILDIIFDDNIPQECDDSLRHLISQMPRLLIPTPEIENFKARSISDKYGEVSYYQSNHELTKYPYFLDGKKSLPLKMYEELHGHNVNEHSAPFFKWYTDDGVCTSTIFLTYPFRPPVPINDQMTSRDFVIHKLGKYLEDSSGLDNLEIENKYILIGDYISDIHHTFVGDMSGTAILFNAYIALVEGRHRISWSIILLIFTLLTVLSYWILSINPFEPKKSVTSCEQLWKESVRRLFVLFYLKIGLLVGVFCCFTYIWQNIIYNIFITSSCMAVLKWLNRPIKAWEMKNNWFDFFLKLILK